MKRFALVAALLVIAGFHSAVAEPRIVSKNKIWDRAAHNAFTDLVRYHGKWFCVFREGSAHVSNDGALRVLASKDGETWASAALITNAGADLRDAKIVITPDDRLMLSGAGALHQPSEVKHQTMAWFSKDGRNWSAPVNIGEPDNWLWRVSWHKDTAYGVGYSTVGPKLTCLYRSVDGKVFTPLVPTLCADGNANEATILFQSDDTALCLLRRDNNGNAKAAPTAQLGTARPPYTDWTWKDLGVKIGGPNFIQLPDGRFIAAVRLYDGELRTSLMWLDVEAGRLTEFLKLPSGGDTSYAGLVWHDDLLWVSYYSSHEGKTAIYLAKVTVN